MPFPKTVQSPEAYLHIIAENIVNKYQNRRVEPPTETTAYTDGDVIWTPIEIPDLVSSGGDSILLDTVLLTNDDEINQPIDLVFMKSAVNIGAVNAAYSFPASDIAELLGTVKIAAADFVDQGDFSAAEKTNLRRIFRTADNSESLWVAGVVRAAATFTSTDGLGLNLGFRRN